jgi:hypothetical protein
MGKNCYGIKKIRESYEENIFKMMKIVRVSELNVVFITEKLF